MREEGEVLEGRLGASCKETVETKLVELVSSSNFTVYIQPGSVQGAFNCRTYLKLFLSQNVQHMYTLFSKAYTNMYKSAKVSTI